MGNKITIGLIFITLGILFYFNFVKQEVVVRESLSVNSTTTDILGKKIATALNQLNSLSLDTSLFQEPGYQSLKSFNQEIFPLPAGKRSPFDPIDTSGFVGSRSVDNSEFEDISISNEEDPNEEVQEELADDSPVITEQN